MTIRDNAAMRYVAPVHCMAPMKINNGAMVSVAPMWHPCEGARLGTRAQTPVEVRLSLTRDGDCPDSARPVGGK